MKRLVIKVGTAVLTDNERRLDAEYVAGLCGQIVDARKQGWQAVLVSSGAIGAGAARLKMRRRPQLIPEKQAAAAVGQGLLQQLYTDSLDALGATAAQVLLTREDFTDRVRYLNARNTLQTLLRFGAVPIINENDTVSVDEIRFGDNDTLAALVGTIVDAHLVVLLTDVEGLCREKPRAGRAPEVIAEVNCITPEIEAIAAGGCSERGGTGGMASKIAAARVAMAAGIDVVIAPGRRPGVIGEILAGGKVGTRFVPDGSHLRSRKRWIAFAVPPRGTIVVNRPAADVLLTHNRSLLPVGIVGVEGEFGTGDLVDVNDDTGRHVARGFVNYGSGDVRKIMGRKTSEIKDILGYKEFDEVIHRDNLVAGV